MEEGWVKWDIPIYGSTVKCYIPKLTKEENKVIFEWLMEKFIDRKGYRRDDDIISFNCSGAGSRVNELATQVKNMFEGFILCRSLYK
ncbi:MAG: hypothetical protein NTU58_01450 [Candidatus Nealsonbacteria bacterium]|nr:hypothetical protein [Candidatus Nealsonbacteria bacterium]